MERKKNNNINEKPHMGRQIHILSHQLKRRKMLCERDDSELTIMQRSVLNYILLSTLVGDVYQKDIEKEFDIRRSTATGILQLMEKNGLVRRESVPQDARLKRIVPTEKAIAIRENVIENICETEDILAMNIDPKDYEICLRVMKKMSENLTKHEKNIKGGSDE